MNIGRMNLAPPWPPLQLRVQTRRTQTPKKLVLTEPATKLHNHVNSYVYKIEHILFCHLG